MNINDIMFRVRRALGEGTEVRDDDIIRWVNDAQREIALSDTLFQNTATAAIVSGQGQYSLPSDRLTIVSLTVDSQVLQNLTFSEAQQLLSNADAAVGRPLYYYIWANTLNLYPIPDGSASVLIVFYTRLPVDVGLVTDTPEIPVQYHARLVDYCRAKAYELDGNPEAMQLAMTAFTTGVQTTKDNSTWDETMFYPSITSLPSDTYDVTYYGW